MPFERVGDVDLYYELVDYTEPWKSGPAPVVFVHGLGGDHHMWLYQVPAFCHRFPVLTVDLRDHGQSSKASHDYTVADTARDLVRLFRVLGIESAHVVGLSLGGIVAQQLALDTPLAVASLTLADTVCGAPEGMEEVMRQTLDEAMRFIEENPMRVVAEARITNAFSDAVDPVMRAHLIDRVAQNDKQAYERAARSAFNLSLRPRLGELNVPTLVVVGDEDRVTPLPLSEDLVQRIAGARLVRIEGAGHITAMEKPVEFNRAVLEFLGRI